MTKVIALDYDGTFTTNPSFWLEFIKLASIAGYQVIGVTMRYPSEIDSNFMVYRNAIELVVFTSRQAKKPYVEKCGLDVDIWIDDRPDFILTDALS